MKFKSWKNAISLTSSSKTLKLMGDKGVHLSSENFISKTE